jgi:hypothetical protein
MVREPFPDSEMIGDNREKGNQKKRSAEKNRDVLIEGKIR